MTQKYSAIPSAASYGWMGLSPLTIAVLKGSILERGEKEMNNKRQFLLVVSVVAIVAFVGGGIAHRYGFPGRIPVWRSLRNVLSPLPPLADRLAEAIEDVFFYPAPMQDSSQILAQIDVSYPFSFVVYGDSREVSSDAKDILLRQILEERPSFFVHVGDLVYSGEEHQWKIFDFFHGDIMSSGIPFYPALGNHEYCVRTEPGSEAVTSFPPDPEDQLEHYFARFPHLGNRRWYSFRYGNSLFVVLDTNSEYGEGSPQHTWLLKTLQDASPRFLFVAFHHPPYSATTRKRSAEQFLASIFEGRLYGEEGGYRKPDIVFCGHAHTYENHLERGIRYIVTGGGGAKLLDSSSRHHYCHMTVYEQSVVFVAKSLDTRTGEWEVTDNFTIEKD